MATALYLRRAPSASRLHPHLDSICQHFSAARSFVSSRGTLTAADKNANEAEAGLAAHRLRSRIDRRPSLDIGASPPSGSAPPPPASVSPSTVLSHAGLPLGDRGHNGGDSDLDGRSNIALAPPIHLATTFRRPASGDYGDAETAPEGKGLVYGRTDNVTRELLERTVGRIETMPVRGRGPGEGVHPTDEELNAKADMMNPDTIAFSSGMAAVSTLLLSHPSPATVVLPLDVYHGVPTLIETVLRHHGIRCTSADLTDTKNLPTRLDAIAREASGTGARSIIVWIESPSNPLLQVVDVPAITEVVRNLVRPRHAELTVTTAVDSTLFPPPLSQPLLSGADFSIHSATKYLGGHSDALLGLITASPTSDAGAELGSRIRQVQQVTGCQASAFDSWLVLRGMRTLHIRVERQCATALAVAQYLEERCSRGGDEIVKKVHYPGISTHPDHKLASRSMPEGLFGGTLSFELTEARHATAMAAAVRVIERGTSLGGTETLIEHRASIEPPERRTSPPGLLRMSVGLEDSTDIINDLSRALWVARQVVQ